MTVTTTPADPTGGRSRRTLLPHDLAWRPGRRRASGAAPYPIRRRRDRDLGACARLLGVVYCADHYPDRLPGSAYAWLVDDVLDAWVAESHGRLLGHVATVRVGTDPVSAARWREITGHAPERLLGVDRFFVRRSERGRGLGSALLTVAAADVRAHGRLPVLETSSRSRGPIPSLQDAGWHLLAIDDRDRSSGWRVHRYAAPPA